MSALNGHSFEPVPPVLRWVGGKQRLAKTICAMFPDDFRHRLYVEPFFGAGSVFFYSRPPRALLADANSDLIEMYEHVRSNPRRVATHLRHLSDGLSESTYYEIRSRYNRSAWSAAQAARFILLNRTCYNGVFRVNVNGDFNVPYGKKPRPVIPTSTHLTQLSTALARARLRAQCFRETLSRVPRHSFVYLDPPYPPLNGTAYFTHYTFDRFAEEDQEDLADAVHALHAAGIPFVLSNADTDVVRYLYDGFYVVPLPVTRYVSCKGKRLAVNELLISNHVKVHDVT